MTNENKHKRNAPIIETSVTKSKDGNWIIHKTIITDIKPVSYFEKVLENSPDSSEVSQ